MLLPALALLLYLLLLLQLLSDAGLAQGLPLTALVGLGVEGRLEGRVPPHAHHHLLPQLREGRGETGDGHNLVTSMQHAHLRIASQAARRTREHKRVRGENPWWMPAGGARTG